MGTKTDGGSPREHVRALPLQIEALCVRLLPCFPRKHLCRPCPLPTPPGIPGPLGLRGASPQGRVGRGGGCVGTPFPEGRTGGSALVPQRSWGHWWPPGAHTPRLALNPHRLGAGRCPRVTWGRGRQDPFLVARGATCAGPCVTAGVDRGCGAGPVTPRGGPGCVFRPSPGRLPSRRLSVSGCVG